MKCVKIHGDGKAKIQMDIRNKKKGACKMDPLSRTQEKRVFKKLLKADFYIGQESAFSDSIDNGHYCNNLYNHLLIF